MTLFSPVVLTPCACTCLRCFRGLGLSCVNTSPCGVRNNGSSAPVESACWEFVSVHWWFYKWRVCFLVRAVCECLRVSNPQCSIPGPTFRY